MVTQTGKTVRELVQEKPAAARVFEKFGIDYCCGGNKSLSEACVSAGVPEDSVIAALDKPVSTPDERDWQAAPLRELVKHIVEKHHAFTREEMKRLEPLLAKVISVHGQNHPELQRVQTIFREVCQELSMHMMKEEQILFPYIVEMETEINSKRPLPPAMFGTVQNPVRMMMMEHDSAGQALHEMSKQTNGYMPPLDACVSYQTLYEALDAFEKDLHRHIHLENNILFPRAIVMEDQAF